MSNFQKYDYILEYPEKEKALGFASENKTPFKSAVIGITYPVPEYHIQSDVRPCVGFEYVVDGEGEIYVNGEWLTAGAGCVFILREGEKHNYRAKPENPWHKLWINYNAEYTGKFLDAYGITTGVYHAPEARQYFERAIELADAPESFIDLCYLIAECVHSIASSVSAHTARGEGCDYSRIRDALDLSVYKKCDLDAIAKTLHMSKSNMIRVFKKHYGVTPYDYLLDRKIETAKLLLNGTSLPVREIADKLCILDEHYFSSLFLKRAGVRPREYRKNQRAVEKRIKFC